MSSSVIIPDEIQKQFPELIALILGSESMNDEERQYWINILPSMSIEQQENLRQILQNEKDQLAAIDTKYAKEGVSVRAVEEIAQERRKKKQGRLALEQEVETGEKDREAQILKEIEGTGSI
ncbi:MAG TPA: hypothetical protein VJB82_05145 [Candidatus Peribacterales bacterium]|nr:hypothetical protein [Candidatus Peribacterales bacterium]